MEKEFVKVNNKILDIQKYKRDMILIKNHIKHRLKEEFALHGFQPDSGRAYPGGMELAFYNKELDLEIKLKIKKKNRWVFV